MVNAHIVPTVHKGVFYWKTADAARAFAELHGVNIFTWSDVSTPRIVTYGRGAAIQLYRSGPYVGPTVSVTTDIA